LDNSRTWFFLIGLGLLLVAGLAVFVWWRHKNQSAAQAAFTERPDIIPAAKKPPRQAKKPAPPPSPKPTPAPASPSTGFVTTKVGIPVKPPPPAPLPQDSTPPQSNNLQIEFAPEKVSATLINAVLSYSVTLTNNSPESLSNIKLNGAMVQADSEAATNDSGQRDEELHRIASLGTGESIRLTGEMRLPLNAIKPISFGTQALFVPLARFTAQYSDGEHFTHYQASCFIIGIEHQPMRVKMAPFRLDLGLRELGPIGQRPLFAR
jgi:hypothetical protein